jgi:hypothetical protein
MMALERLLREPLLHFFVFGGLIFLLYVAVSGPTPEPVDTIVIEPARIEQLGVGFQRVWRRPPTVDELRALVDGFIREEIYYREALALGLDRNDTVVRQRLRQKMEFLMDTGADLLEPAAGELEAYLAANEQTFRREARLALEQVYLGETPTAESIEAALSAHQSDPATDPSPWSEHALLPAELGLSPPSAVDGVFGNGFFDRLAEIPAGVWIGPVESAYGVHLVRIIDRVSARVPPLEEVQDAELRDWKADKALELRELH